MRRRHHYATTGARLFLSVRADFDADVRVFHRDPAVFGPDTAFETARGATMGDIVGVATGAANDRARLSVDIVGSSPLERIDLFDGPDLLHTIRPNSPQSGPARRFRVIWQGAKYRGRGRNLPWNGEVTVEGNTIESFASVNFWSPDNQPLRTADDRIAFRGLTAGNLQGLDLTCADAGAGRLRFTSDRGNASVDLDALPTAGARDRARGTRCPGRDQPGRRWRDDSLHLVHPGVRHSGHGRHAPVRAGDPDGRTPGLVQSDLRPAGGSLTASPDWGLTSLGSLGWLDPERHCKAIEI